MTELRTREASGRFRDTVLYASSERQDRLERAIFDLLRNNSTRSELRELVAQLADYLRVRGVSADKAISAVRALGLRAAPHMNADDVAAVGDSAADRIIMMVRWCSAQYHRSD